MMNKKSMEAQLLGEKRSPNNYWPVKSNKFLSTFCYYKDLNNLIKYLQKYFMYSSMCLDLIYKISMIHTSNTRFKK